jgi:hypothetical protein
MNCSQDGEIPHQNCSLWREIAFRLQIDSAPCNKAYRCKPANSFWPVGGWRGQGIVGLFEQVRTMAKLTSYQSDIRPLFTERDIQAMSKAFNLASYDDVKAHAAVIYDRIRGIGGAEMPPPPPRGEGPWPQASIELFAQWMADGFQP